MSVITSPQIKQFVELAKHVKKVSPKTPVVWGGPHPTINPRQVADEDYVDSVVIGAGEETFPQMVWDSINGKELSKIKKSNRFDIDKYTPRWNQFRDLNQFLFREDHSVRGNKVGDTNIFYYLSTSRGCHGGCSFCAVPKISRGRIENHSVDHVKKQLEYLASNTNMSGVGIWDDMFWTDRGRAYKILEELSGRGLGYLIEARADQLLAKDKELFKKLKDTGCLQVFVGAESGNQPTLNYLNKGTKVKDYHELARLAQDGLPVRYSLIVGFPRETDESVNDTLDMAQRLGETDNCSISGPKLFTPYAGTVEFKRALKEGFEPPRSTEEWSQIHRRTDDYINKFPWIKNNLRSKTISRLEKELR